MGIQLPACTSWQSAVVVKHEVAQPSRFSSPMRRLLTSFSWQELRHHPWRNAAAVVAVMLGVALAFSVHLINASALTEFARAVRSVNGQPDLSLRAVSSGFDEALYGELARHPSIQAITPVVEISTYAVTDSGEKQALRVLGVDALTLGSINPEVIPVPGPYGRRGYCGHRPQAVHLRARRRVFKHQRTAIDIKQAARIRQYSNSWRCAIGRQCQA
jgi:hypothetical protein